MAPDEEIDKHDEANEQAAESQEQQGEKEVSPEEGVEALKERLKRSEEALEFERKQSRELAVKSSRAENEVQNSNLELIKGALQSVNQESKLLKQQYADALRDGRFEDAAQIQEGIALNTAKFLQLENGRVALEEELKKPPRPVIATPSDPVEKLAAQLSPKSAAWVRSHPEYATDNRKYTRMISAHNIAIAEGYVADTPEYFQFVENELGINRKPVRRADDDDEGSELSSAAAAKGGRNAPPVAPTSNAGSSQVGNRGNSARLTSDEKEVAKMMGISEEEYAKNKASLKREGRLN